MYSELVAIWLLEIGASLKAKLTKKAVETAIPSDKDYLIWDTDTTGFGVKITRAGKRVYVLQYRISHRQNRFTIGQHGIPWTLEQARKEAVRLLGDVAKNQDPASEKSNMRQAPTLAQFAERFLEQHARPKKKGRTTQEYERLLRTCILPELGELKLLEIKPSDIVRFHNSMFATPYQANRVLALLSTMFGLAEKWELKANGTNPCRNATKFKEYGHERVLSSEEMQRLGESLASAKTSGKELPGALNAIWLLLLTGARNSEILTCRWEYIDFDRKCIHLPDSKTGQKVIPLGDAALSYLSAIEPTQDNPFICPGQNQGRHLVGLQKAWDRIRKDAGLDDLRIHDLRHNFASVGAMNNMSLHVLGKMLGHKTQSTTARYAHLSADPVRFEANRISEIIVGSINGAKQQESSSGTENRP